MDIISGSSHYFLHEAQSQNAQAGVMISFTEVAERIICSLAEAEAETSPAAANVALLLDRVRHVAKLHVKDLDSVLSRRRVRATASVTKRECELMRDEGTKVFQVGLDRPLSVICRLLRGNFNQYAYICTYRAQGISWIKGSVCFVLKFTFPPFSTPLLSGVQI